MVELALGDHYLFKMNPDLSRKWHPLLLKSRDQVNAILGSVDLVNDPRGLHKVTQQLVSGRLIADSAGYEVVKIVTDGPKFREEWERGGAVVFNGTVGATLDPANRQATLGRFASAMVLNSLKMNLVQRPAQASPAVPKRRAYILNKDGTLHRWTSYWAPEGTWSEITLYGYKQYAEGLTFPTVQIDAAYVGVNADTLYRLSMIVVEEAEFGAKAPLETFQAAVPKNTALWHWSRLHAATEPIADVLTLSEQ